MKQTYKEQLTDGRWLRKKNEILERDNYTCQRCGATSNLQVHHREYLANKKAWEYPNEDLITLCVNCHENEHNIVPIPRVGVFYTYDHSDYTNDMICYDIDDNFVYLFGVDNGGYGTPYLDYFSFEEFFARCKKSCIHFNIKEEKCDTYTTHSFYLAYQSLLKNPISCIPMKYPYKYEQHIAYTTNKIKKVVNSRYDIIEAFEIMKNW